MRNKDHQLAYFDLVGCILAGVAGSLAVFEKHHTGLTRDSLEIVTSCLMTATYSSRLCYIRIKRQFVVFRIRFQGRQHDSTRSISKNYEVMGFSITVIDIIHDECDE